MTVWSIITIPDAMQRLLSLFFSSRFRSSLFRAGLFLMAALAVPPVCGASGFDGGDGSREAPYLISSPEGLAALGGYCGPAHRDKHFILTGDIVLKGAWTPIGSSSAVEDGTGAFQGKLDGRGHTISNVSVQTDGLAHAGLFAALHEADIRDIHLRNVSVSQTVRAVSSAGGLAAFSKGTRFLYCTVEGSVSSLYEAGGLVGRDGGGSTFVRCGAACSVSASFFAGGFLGTGHAGSSLEGCYSQGRVVVTRESGVEFDSFFHGYGGGMAAFLPEADDGVSSTFRNCFSTCTVEADDEGKTFTLGGFMGFASCAGFMNCAASGSVRILHSAKGWAGGFSGDSVRCRYVNCAVRGVEVSVYSSQDYACAGGFSGRNGLGSSENCRSVSRVAAHAAAASGACTAMAGGFTGYNHRGGTFSRCYGAGNVEGTAGSYYAMAGGFCGYDMGGSYTGCAASGSVAGTAASVYAGGILGYMADSVLENNAFNSASAISAHGEDISAVHRANNRNGASASVGGSGKVWNGLGFSFGEDDSSPWKMRQNSLPELYFESSQKAVTVFRISPEQLSLGREGAGGVRIDVVCEGAWNVASHASWAVPETLSGHGDGSFTVTAAPNNSPASRSGSMEVATPEGLTRLLSIIQAGSPYDQWKKDRFPDGTPEGQMAPDACPAGDGISNLMKYATGLDPLKPCGSVTRLTVREKENGGKCLVLEWPINPQAVDVEHSVECSPDLETWAPVQVMETKGKTEAVFEDPEPVHGGNARRFLRLKVTRQ